MKRLLLIACCFIPGLSWAADSWYHALPSNLDPKSAENIPAAQYFEAAASKEATAEAWLAAKQFMPLQEPDVEFFGQRNFKCPASTSLYLVRAVYENGGTGGFFVKKLGTALLVSHLSMGEGAAKTQRTALIACLGFKPTEVYHVLGGGR